MKTLYSIISELAAEPSTTKKVQILTKYKDNALLKEAFFMTLDPFTNYYITAKTPTTSGTNEIDFVTLLDVKSKLAGRIVTGNAAIEYLNTVMFDLTEEDQTILKRIINHDLDCKVAGGLVNRVWPGLITEFPVMLSDKFNEKTVLNIPEGPDAIIVQLKADGGRVEIVVDDKGDVSVYSRSGNLLQTFGVFASMFSTYVNTVFDGELLVIDETGINNRQSGNGIFNKAVRGTISMTEAMSFHIVLWDMIPINDWKNGKCTIPYKTRLDKLIDIQSKMTEGKTSIVETKIVSDMTSVQKFYEEMIERGEEGAMVKPSNMIWEAKRSKFCLKLKEVKDATLRCVGVSPHSKFPDQIGSLDCITSCGKLAVSIGSGLTEEDRKRPASYYLGNLIDMQYNALITKRNNAMISMFLPRYSNIRLDKSDADTLEHLK